MIFGVDNNATHGGGGLRYEDSSTKEDQSTSLFEDDDDWVFENNSTDMILFEPWVWGDSGAHQSNIVYNKNENCKGILITSCGGVGSSLFLKQLNSIAILNNILFNNHDDIDGFKHMPATWWKEHSTSSIVGHFMNHTFCFHKALLIIGDPVHAIESTNRRFNGKHINKLKNASGLGTYPMPVHLNQIYQDIAASGKDQTGLANYIQSWYDASLDIYHWPEIKLVTAHVLYDNAVDIAKWIGVTRDVDLKKFSTFHFDTTKRKSPNKLPGITDELRGTIAKVFENVTAIIDRIEEEANVSVR